MIEAVVAWPEMAGGNGDEGLDDGIIKGLFRLTSDDIR